MRIAVPTLFSCLWALVAIAEGQDFSMMFQALGMEAPILPPTMPKSLRDHLYPHQQVMKQRMQLMQQRQRQQMMAIRAAQMRESAKPNPYSAPYNVQKVNPMGRQTLTSGANTIRRPGQAVNRLNKMNPYASPNNPYSTSRAESSQSPTVRRRAMTAARMGFSNIGPRGRQMSNRKPKFMTNLKKMTNPSKKIKEAKLAGCKLPVDNTAASLLMFSTCRSRAAQMICGMELMQCTTVGMTAMCCPPGMSNLAMDTLSYVNKLQAYVSEVA